MSVTSEYGASDQTPARGAWTVTKRRPVSTGARPAHQERRFPVARQYAKRSDAGRIRKRQGSSAPFQSAIALADGSASSVPTTWRSSDSRQPPGRSWANALRFTQVESPFDAAARFSAIVRARSSAVQAPAGPTLSTFTPGRRDLGKPVGRRPLRQCDREDLPAVQHDRRRAGPTASSPRRRAGRARVPAAGGANASSPSECSSA